MASGVVSAGSGRRGRSIFCRCSGSPQSLGIRTTLRGVPPRGEIRKRSVHRSAARGGSPHHFIHISPQKAGGLGAYLGWNRHRPSLRDVFAEVICWPDRSIFPTIALHSTPQRLSISIIISPPST